MTTTYVIEKLRHASIDPNLADDRSWVEAYGLNEKSWPKMSSDEEAIEHFRSVVAKARSPRRLIKLCGGGYGTFVKALDKFGF